MQVIFANEVCPFLPFSLLPPLLTLTLSLHHSQRTFLKWLHFAVLLATIATGLLNFVPMKDAAGIYSAFAFTVCALVAVAYSAGVFLYRAYSLRKVSGRRLCF